MTRASNITVRVSLRPTGRQGVLLRQDVLEADWSFQPGDRLLVDVRGTRWLAPGAAEAVGLAAADGGAGAVDFTGASGALLRELESSALRAARGFRRALTGGRP